MSIDPARTLAPELRFLLERHPRDVWEGHARLGELGRFWLQRHAMFRELGGALSEAVAAFRDDRLPLEQLRPWFAPRLRLFLTQLEEHHLVEDQHYFPVFRRSEPRLAKGFAFLEGDHHQLERDLHALAQAAASLLEAITGSPDAARKAADAYVGTSDRLVRGLLRHLDDEEDLVIPLLLDRGEP